MHLKLLKIENLHIHIRITHSWVLSPVTSYYYIVKLRNKGVFIFFLIFDQNIDCVYTLEPPHRYGSNVYTQSFFFGGGGGKNKKKHHNFSSDKYLFYSCEKLQYSTWACFRNENNNGC